METFMASYIAIWLAVVFYVARLGVQQCQLQRTLDEIQERVNNQENTQESPSQAA